MIWKEGIIEQRIEKPRGADGERKEENSNLRLNFNKIYNKRGNHFFLKN